MTVPGFTLAQSSSGAASVLLWVGVLVAVCVAGGLVMVAVRRKMLAEDSRRDDGSMLDHLRDQVARGELSQDEFDAIKRRVVARLAEQMAPDKAEPPARPGPFPGAKLPKAEQQGILRAQPGFDLTGRPLPKPGDSSPRSDSAADDPPDRQDGPDRAGGAAS